jgi:1,4-alpha-glucan branching enzyme
MWAHPGGKLLFMGNEFGQTTEWNYKSELDWHLLQYDLHRGMKDCVAELNRLLRAQPALYQNQFNHSGFEWVDLYHREESVIVFRRKGNRMADDLLIILNMTPVVRMDWEITVREKTYTKEIFNSDSAIFGGTGDVFNPDIRSTTLDRDQKIFRITVNLPPLAWLILK